MQRISLQPAWILHATDYRDSSKIVRCLTRDYGRVDGVVRGAKRIRRGQPQVVQPFMPVLLSFVGRNTLKTITGIDVQPGYAAVPAKHYLSACYVNELLLQLLGQSDANIHIFDDYTYCLSQLSTVDHAAGLLRQFEYRLLTQLGYGLQLDCDISGQPIEPDQWYHYQLETGAVSCAPTHELAIQGEGLLALAEDRGMAAEHGRALKSLLHSALHWHGTGKPSKVRQVWREVHALSDAAVGVK